MFILVAQKARRKETNVETNSQSDEAGDIQNERGKKKKQFPLVLG